MQPAAVGICLHPPQQIRNLAGQEPASTLYTSSPGINPSLDPQSQSTWIVPASSTKLTVPFSPLLSLPGWGSEVITSSTLVPTLRLIAAPSSGGRSPRTGLYPGTDR